MGWSPSPERSARLRDSLVWVGEHSPYHRRLFADAGVKIAGVPIHPAQIRAVTSRFPGAAGPPRFAEATVQA